MPETPAPTGYQTLVELQDAHDALMGRLHAEPEALGRLYPEVRELLTRGAATGACLDEPRERRAAQAILDYWASQCYAANLDLPRPTLAAHDPTQLPQLDEQLCPFVGLDAFAERHAGLFHGRDALVTELLRRLADERLVVVTGASGSGKSSLVLAGLLPALRKGALAGSAQWIYPPVLVPGAAPLEQLLSGLLPWLSNDGQGRDRAARLQELRAAPETLAEELGGLAQPLVLVIDQFEELLTLRTAETAADFDVYVRALVALIECEQPRHRLVLTMRSDVETRLAREYPQLNQRYGKSAFPLSAMGPAQLREAIEAPAAQVGLKFQPGVVDDLVRSVVGEEAGLPLLQFTLRALWQRRQGNLVTQEALRAVGNPRRAMAAAAESLFAELSDEQRQAAQRIFLALGRLDPSQQSAAVYRNRASRRLLQGLSEPQLVDAVIGKYERLGLLRVTREVSGEPLEDRVEVAHEALLRNWERLQRLFAERRDERQRRAFLHQQAVAWRSSGFDDAYLLGGLALRQAEEELAREPMDAIDQEFVARARLHEDGVQAQAKLEAAQREQVLREKAEVADQQALLANQRAQQVDELARRQRRDHLILLLALALAFLAIWAWAQHKIGQAGRQLEQAEQALAQSQAQIQRQRDQTSAWVREREEDAERVRDEAARQLAQAKARIAEAEAKEAQQRRKAERADGERFLIEAEQRVAADADASLHFVDKALRAAPELLSRTTPVLLQALRYRRDSQRIASREFESVEVLALSPGGRRLLMGDTAKLQEWSLEDAQPRKLHEAQADELGIGTLHHALFLPDGRAVLATDAGVWFWQQGRLRVLDAEAQVRRLRLSDDGLWLAAVGRQGEQLHLWRLGGEAQAERHALPLAGTAKARDLLFLPRQGALVVLPRDESAGQSAQLRVHERLPGAAGFSSQARLLDLPGCQQGVLPLAAGGPWLGRAIEPRLCLQLLRGDAGASAQARQVPLEGRVDQLVFSADGRYAVRLAQRRGEALVMDLVDGSSYRLQGRFEAPSADSDALIAVDAQSRRLAMYGSDDQVRVYPLGGGIGALAEAGGVLWMSADDRLAVVRGEAALGEEAPLQLRRVEDGALLRALGGGGGAAAGARGLGDFSLSADGRWLHARGRCGERALPCLVSHAVHEPTREAHAMPFQRLLEREGGLAALQTETEWLVYAAELQQVLWRAPRPAAADRSGRTALQLSLGSSRRFLVQRDIEGRSRAEVFDVDSTGQLQSRLVLEQPLAQRPRFVLGGQGRLLLLRTERRSALWDLQRTGPAPLWDEEGVWERVHGHDASGRVALRRHKNEAWSLRRLDQPDERASLPADFRFDPLGRMAWRSTGGSWEVRDLRDPREPSTGRSRTLSGPGQVDRVSLNAAGNVLSLRSDADSSQQHREYPGGRLLLTERFQEGGAPPAHISGGGAYLLNPRTGQLQPARAERLLAAAREEARGRVDPAEMRCRLEQRCAALIRPSSSSR